MFGLFRRLVSAPSTSSTSSPIRSRAFVEGLEGRSMMSVTPLGGGSQASLLPAVQHGLLLPAVHPAGAASSTPGSAGQAVFIIAI